MFENASELCTYDEISSRFPLSLSVISRLLSKLTVTRLKVRSERELEFSKITMEAPLSERGSRCFSGMSRPNISICIRPTIYSDEKWKGEEAWKKKKSSI